MSTRGCYRFTDETQCLTVYKHSDNYPDGQHGGVAAIAKTLPIAWELPRFEADEFAAAFIAANKGGSGNVRLLNTPDRTTLEHMPFDIEYLYDVTEKGGKLMVKVSEIVRPQGWSGDTIEARKIASGTLQQMVTRFQKR